MRKSIAALVAVLVIFSVGLQAQVIDPQHEDRIKKLEQQLTALEQQVFITDSLTYNRQYQQVQDGYFLFKDLVNGTEEFAADIKKSAFLLKLMNLNNPSSLQLRKKIMDEIQGLVESRIEKLVGKDTARKRSFFNIVRNIFNNPLLNTALHAIPISGPVMNIVSAVSAIVAPKVTVNTGKVLGTEFVKNINLDIESLVEESPLKEISGRIMPYLQFYDTLYALNNRIQEEMSFIRDKNDELRRLTWEQLGSMKYLTGWTAEAGTNMLTDNFNKHFIFPAFIRTDPRYTPAYKQKMDSLLEVSQPVVANYKKFLALKTSYDAVFERIKKDYLRIMKAFSAKSPLLKEYLDPSIAQIEELDKPDMIVASKNIPVENIPAAVNGEQARQIQMLRFKYRDYSDESRTRTIKRILTDN